jgi:Na+:H+ antiporter, NhaA family
MVKGERAMLSALREFLRLEAAGGMLLVLAAIAALMIANSPFAGLYEEFLAIPGVLGAGPLEIRKPLVAWLDDGWMAVFFLLVGLEIKREFIEGELADPRARTLPVIGALGGMAVPALIYAGLNHGSAIDLRGWAIPTATDIAFALAVMSLLGDRVPIGLKLLLTAIAIIDDLGAILIIAVFYTADLSLPALGLALIGLIGLAALNLAGVRPLTPYLLSGIGLWLAVLKSGVHPTLAGVATAFAIPLGRRPGEPDGPGLKELEAFLHPWVAFLILPAFAFANAGVSFAGIGLQAMAEPVTLGIAAGLLIGKPIGVWGAMWLAVAVGLARSPEGATWTRLLGVALLCGIGFTMSLFIGGLAFDDPAHAVQVRLGVLAGSLASAILGYAVLARGR